MHSSSCTASGPLPASAFTNVASSSSSSFPRPSYSASHAFDGQPLTQWGSFDDGAGDHINYDGSLLVGRQLGVFLRSCSVQHAPRAADTPMCPPPGRGEPAHS